LEVCEARVIVVKLERREMPETGIEKLLYTSKPADLSPSILGRFFAVSLNPPPWLMASD